MEHFYKTGDRCFLKNSFFEKINNPNIKYNKNSNRPWIFLFKDKEDLFWFVPTSSKVEKFKNIINERLKKGRDVDYIQIIFSGKEGGTKKEIALLYQDMIPVEKKDIQKYLNSIKNPEYIKTMYKTGRKYQNLFTKDIELNKGQVDLKDILLKIKMGRGNKMFFEKNEEVYFTNIKEIKKNCGLNDKDIFKSLLKGYKTDYEFFGASNDNKEKKNIEILEMAIKNKDYNARDFTKILYSLGDSEFNLAVKLSADKDIDINKEFNKKHYMEAFDNSLEPIGYKKTLIEKNLENKEALKIICNNSSEFWEDLKRNNIFFEGYDQKKNKVLINIKTPDHSKISEIPFPEWKNLKILNSPAIKYFYNDFYKECPALRHLSTKGIEKINDILIENPEIKTTWKNVKDYIYNQPELNDLKNEINECKIKEFKLSNQSKELGLALGN